MSEPYWVPLGAQPPGGKELAYVERTSTLSVSATTEASSEVVISAGAIVYDGSPVWFEFYSPVVEYTQYCYFTLWDGETNLGSIASASSGSDNDNENAPICARRKHTPSPGAHTFSVRVTRGTGSAAVYAGTGFPGYMPAYLRITQEDVVPVVPAGAPPIATALPGSPVDGAEVILVDSLTAPTYQWHLRYIAAKATDKWVFIGGAPAYSEINVYEGINPSTWVDMPTPGPSLTVPVSGVYSVGFGMMEEVAVNLGNRYMGIPPAGSGDPGNNVVNVKDFGTVAAQVNLSRECRLVTPAGLVKALYYVDNGQLWAQRRWLRMAPVAVGG